MFLIFFLIFGSVSTTPRRYNYNCVSMQAEVFPVGKIPCNYGIRSYQLRGKDYDELQAKIPMYKQKIVDTELDLAKSVPSDRDEAKTEYLSFKEMLFSRDNQVGFTQSAEDGFKDRMKLEQYCKILGSSVSDSYRILDTEDSLDWLDQFHFVYYNAINFAIYSNYLSLSNTRPSKSISKTDYCTLLAKSLESDDGWAQGTAKDAHKLVFRCYDAFPYNDAAAKMIHDMFLLMIDFYVFSNFTTNGVGANVIYSRFKEQEFNFDSSLHFHDFFGRVLNKLNDAHISYKVDCYEQFTFVQPLFIQHITQSNQKGGIYITKINTLGLQEWIGAEVVAIDGNDATRRIDEFGYQIGKSRAGSTRDLLGYSRLFFESSIQDFRLDRGLYLKRINIPNNSYMIYTLKMPNTDNVVEIKVPWMVYKNPTLATFKDQYSYWDKNCEANHFTRIAKGMTTKALQKRSPGTMKPYFANIRKRSRVQKRSTAFRATIDGITPIALGPGFAFFILNDVKYGDYGVLVIHTFDAPDTESWFKNMRIGFTTLMDKGITRLLLDLTGNSGGMLCLAYSLLGVLSPSPVYPYPATEFTYGTRAVPTDSLERIATCVDEAKIKVSPFKLQSFTNLVTRTEFPDGYNWGSESEVKPKFLNGLSYGYTRFSLFLMDKCIMPSTPLLANVKPKFTTIILVSDGMCGSSCAIIVTYLQQHGSPAIVISTKEGNNGHPSLYSFAGGQVVNFNNLKDVAKRSSCFKMIPDVLEKTQMTITYRAIFNIEDKQNPLEYYVMPANSLFKYTSEYASSYALRWKSFFQEGMNIFENPSLYKTNTSDSRAVFPY